LNESLQKKKVLFHSAFSKIKSGFGRNSRAILTYLYNTGKYEIIEYGNAPLKWKDPLCKTVPWKCYGALPEGKISNLDPNLKRHISYGASYIDKIIQEEKPDVYIGVEDIWAFNGYWDKPWWNKIPCVIWTTLDSLPIYRLARDNVDKIKNFWVWASFAEKAMHELGHDHVKTMHGSIDTNKFKPLPNKNKLKNNFGIEADGPIFGFVFRNQTRKLVGSLLEAFSKYKNEAKEGKLLLHTNWNEGWNIPEFIEEFKINKDDVLATHVCKKCKQVQISPFLNNPLDCKSCLSQGSCLTPSPSLGVSEEKLNEIYNIMDAYVHPMTSGGLELPIVEAMLVGLPIATVPYSCGTEFTCQDFVYSLKYFEYREVISNFKKASVTPESILDFMNKVYFSEDFLSSEGKKGIPWAKENFSIEVIGKKIENFLDNLPQSQYNYSFSPEKKDENFKPNEKLDDENWLKELYKGMLKIEEPSDSEGIRDWVKELEKGTTREEIYSFFLKTAREENDKNFPLKLEDFIQDNEKKKIVYVMPQSIGDCVISLTIIKELSKIYPSKDWDLYVCTKPENFEIFKPFGYIKNLIPYCSEMNDFRIWEGDDKNDGVVDIALMPFLATQEAGSYIHNGLDVNQLQT